MKSMKRSVKHARYVLGSLSAVLFAAASSRHLLTRPKPAGVRAPPAWNSGGADLVAPWYLLIP